MLRTGCFHTRWEKFRAAMLRAREEFASRFGEAAAQDQFHLTGKMIRAGKGAQREVEDWDLTPVAQLYTCLKSDLPDTNLWFVATGLEALGFVAHRKEATEVPVRQPYQVSLNLPTAQEIVAGGFERIVAHPDGTVEISVNLKFAADQVKLVERQSVPALPAPSPRKRLPYRHDTRGLQEYFDSGYGNWEQATQVIKWKLWNDDKSVPHWVNVGDLVQQVRETMRVTWNLEVSESEEHPTWKTLVFALNRVMDRLPPDAWVRVMGVEAVP
jgi:hypothetical protein